MSSFICWQKKNEWKTRKNVDIKKIDWKWYNEVKMVNAGCSDNKKLEQLIYVLFHTFIKMGDSN